MADSETLEQTPDEIEASEESAEKATPANERGPLLESIRQPISADEPCGEKVTYDDDFQQLKTQINSIESATGETDYEQIVELGTKILTEKSKDLNTVCYLALGLARQQGFEGVARGIGAARLMVETYWDDLYPAPRRMAGRRNALQFLADRIKDWLQNCDDPAEADREALLQAQADLDVLQSFCMEEMEEQAPAFSGIKSALDKVIDRLPEPEPDEEEDDAASAEGPSAAADGEFQSVSEAKQAISRATAFLRDQQDPDPVPYRLLRVMRWGILQEEPPSENGQTRIDPPLEQRRTYLRSLAEDDEHETLVEEAEASFQNSPFHFWLDLQRLLVGTMEALGEDYAPVRDAILTETALLVERLPGLPALAFRDGTPFADPLTRDWLDAEVKPVLGSAGQTTGGEERLQEQEDRLAEQYREARQQLGAGNLQEALATMRNGAAQDDTQKERFRRRLYVADLCVKGQKPVVARPILERLDQEIDRHALEVWNPSLALEVWTNLHTCYKTLVRSAPQAQKQALNQQAREAFEKICRVDPTRALAMGEA